MTTFNLMIAIWGYACDGTADVSARIAEKLDLGRPDWDMDANWLDHIELNGTRPPESFALWWVKEQERRSEQV